MTNLELQIKVAETTGWTELQQDEYHNYWGVPPTSRVGYYTGQHHRVRIPNWPTDLTWCMRDLWPWLKEHTTAPVLEYGEETEEWYFYDRLGSEVWKRGDTEALAICHAVLAVAEKMKEGSNDSKG